jgi:hypothetical protein
MAQEIKTDCVRYIEFRGDTYIVFLRDGQYSISVPERNNGQGKIPGGVIYDGLPKGLKSPYEFLDVLEQTPDLLQSILETHRFKF